VGHVELLEDVRLQLASSPTASMISRPPRGSPARRGRRSGRDAAWTVCGRECVVAPTGRERRTARSTRSRRSTPPSHADPSSGPAPGGRRAPAGSTPTTSHFPSISAISISLAMISRPRTRLMRCRASRSSARSSSPGDARSGAGRRAVPRRSCGPGLVRRSFEWGQRDFALRSG